MGSRADGLARLALMVDRLMDAEVVPDEEGAALRTEADTARRCLETGDEDAVRRHVDQITRFAEALVTSSRLDAADGLALVETARRLVRDDG
jgi:hypothetical protein